LQGSSGAELSMDSAGLAWALVGFLSVACVALVVLLVRARSEQSAAVPAAAAQQPPAAPAAAERRGSEELPSGFHQLNFELQARGRAKTFRSGGSGTRKLGGVVRIALTGGPCAGKSSALPYILEAAKKDGFDCYVGPETATVIMNCGCAVPDTIEGLQIFQSQIFRMQLQMESALTNVAEETKRPSIIIFDRGIFDGKGYCPSDEFWENVISEYSRGSSREEIEEMLMLRYEAVVHMVTAAEGADHYYKFGNTTDNQGKPVTRRESPEEAIALDHKMWQVWDSHENHIKVGNSGTGFDYKLTQVAERIVNVAKAVIDDIGANSNEDSETMEKRRSMEVKLGEMVTREISTTPGPTVGNMASRMSARASRQQQEQKAREEAVAAGLEPPAAREANASTEKREPLLQLPV